MLRFLGFKASLNLSSGKSSGIEHYDKSPGVSINGAYRTNKDELFGSVHYTEPPKRIAPSTVKLPTNNSRASNSQSRSTTDVSKVSKASNIRKSAPDIPQAIRKSAPDIPEANKKAAPDIPQAINREPTDQLSVNNIKDQKKLEKQRRTEQKKQEKLIEKEKQREEKERKNRQKQMQESREVANINNVKKSKKRTAPQPNEQKQMAQKDVPSQSQKPQFSTNTLESSISKSSGPPPYSSITKSIPNQNDTSGNTSFAKPVNDMDSWDLISQHRQQMSRQAGVTKNIPKNTHLDLHYTVGTTKWKAKHNKEPQ